MAESTLSLTFNDIAAEVGYILNYGKTVGSFTAAQLTDVTSVIARGLRQFYFPPPLIALDPTLRDEVKSHQWSFLKITTTLSTNAPYSTGTVTIVDGVVTLASGTFPTWAAQGDLTVSGSTYTVSSRDSGTQVTLVDTSVDVDAGTSYSLAQTRFDLPDSFGAMSSSLTYAPNNSNSSIIPLVSEEQIRLERSYPNAGNGKPRLCAVRPKNPVGTSGQRFELLLYPNPDAVYVFYYRYTVLLDAITTTQYPPGSMAHAETILASCLDIAMQVCRNNEGIVRQRADFAHRLIASVHHDREALVADRLGYNGDPGMGETWNIRSCRDQNEVTVSGVQYPT